MGCIVMRDGVRKRVKNLGWLIKHWKEVETVHFIRPADSKSLSWCTLLAKVRDGEHNTWYYTPFASEEVYRAKFDSHNKYFEGVTQYYTYPDVPAEITAIWDMCAVMAY